MDCEILDGEGLRWSPLSEATRDIASVVFFFYPKEKFVDRQALASMLDKKKKKEIFSSRRERADRLQYRWRESDRARRPRDPRIYWEEDEPYARANVIVIIINLNRSRDQYRHNYAR